MYDHDSNYSKDIGDIDYIKGSLYKRYGSCNIYNNKDGYLILTKLYENYYKIIDKITNDNYINFLNLY